MVTDKTKHATRKGICKYGDKWRATFTFHLFGITASRLASHRAARASHDAMKRVKEMVVEDLKKLLLEGKPLLLEDHISAVKKAVEGIRGTSSTVDVDEWKYFANIRPCKAAARGKAALRVKPTQNLQSALKKWRDKCIMCSYPTLSSLSADCVSYVPTKHWHVFPAIIFLCFWELACGWDLDDEECHKHVPV